MVTKFSGGHQGQIKGQWPLAIVDVGENPALLVKKLFVWMFCIPFVHLTIVLIYQPNHEYECWHCTIKAFSLVRTSGQLTPLPHRPCWLGLHNITEMPFILLLTDNQWRCQETGFGCDWYELLASCIWTLCSGNGEGQRRDSRWVCWSRWDWNF